MIYVCIVRTLCGRHKPDPCRTCIGPTVEICKSSQCLNHKKLQMELEETPTKCIHIQTKIWAKLLVLQTTATGALTKSASSLGSFQRSVCCCAKCPNQQRMDYQYYQSTKKLPVRYWLGACQIQAVLKIAVLKGWWSCSDGLESSCRSFCSFMRKSPKNTVGQFLNEAFPEFPSDPSWESSTCHRFRIGQIIFPGYILELHWVTAGLKESKRYNNLHLSFTRSNLFSSRFGQSTHRTLGTSITLSDQWQNMIGKSMEVVIMDYSWMHNLKSTNSQIAGQFGYVANHNRAFASLQALKKPPMPTASRHADQMSFPGHWPRKVPCSLAQTKRIWCPKFPIMEMRPVVNMHLVTKIRTVWSPL